MQMIRAGIEFLGIMGGEKDGEVPLKAVLHAFGSISHGIVWPDIDGLTLFGSVIDSSQKSAIATAIDHIIVSWVNGQMSAFSSSTWLPVPLADGAFSCSVQHASG